MTVGRALPNWRHGLYHTALRRGARRPERSGAHLAVEIRRDDSWAGFVQLASLCVVQAAQVGLHSQFLEY